MKSTDNQEEMFVVVDKNDNIIGKATRKECHNNNKLIHRGVNIFILNKKDEILITKRSEKKDLYPGILYFSAAGHVSPGETYEQAAKREIKEELGLEIKEKDLINLGKIFFGKKEESEFDVNFAVRKNIGLGNIKIDKTETRWAKYYTLNEVRQILQTKPESFVKSFDEVFNLLCKHYGW